nr:L,D-transpeptidase family protein [Chitinophagaceae bacterium]
MSLLTKLSPKGVLWIVLYNIFVLSACTEAPKRTSHHTEGIIASHAIDTSALNHLLEQRIFSESVSQFFVGKTDTVDKLEIFKKVYAAKKCLWIEKQGIKPIGSDLLKVLADLQYDGINIERYQLSELESLSKQIEKEATDEILFSFETLLTDAFLKASRDMVLGYTVNANKEIKNKNDSMFNEVDVLKLALENENMSESFRLMQPQHPWYRKFRKEYIRLSQMKMSESFPTIHPIKDSLVIGDSSVQIALLRKRLFRDIQLPEDTSSAIWKEDVKEGLERFQYLHQLKVTGKPDTATIHKLNASIETKLKSLALNMERMRWLQHDFRQPYIWVAIPKMEMEYVEKDSIAFQMRVVIGRPSRATPALDASILNVVLSPPWNVPPTIMKEEVIPGIARRGGAYLARRGLKAYDRRGRVVHASAINARNYRNFSIGQAPGYRSSLGEVKFNMPNPWAIYMHDTPHREDFVKSYRAYSSGCVRVHKPKEFATFLLRDSINYSYQKIDSICKLRKTIFVPINRQIDVHFVYLTNAVDSAGNIMYLKDVYKWD